TLDCKLLGVAGPGMDPGPRLVGPEVSLDACFPRRAAALRGLDDEPGETLAPPAVETVGLRVLVYEPLELARRAGQAGCDQRRGAGGPGHGGGGAPGGRRPPRGGCGGGAGARARA